MAKEKNKKKSFFDSPPEIQKYYWQESDKIDIVTIHTPYFKTKEDVDKWIDLKKAMKKFMEKEFREGEAIDSLANRIDQCMYSYGKQNYVNYINKNFPALEYRAELYENILSSRGEKMAWVKGFIVKIRDKYLKENSGGSIYKNAIQEANFLIKALEDLDGYIDEYNKNKENLDTVIENANQKDKETNHSEQRFIKGNFSCER